MDLSQLPLTNEASVPGDDENNAWWRGVTWHKTVFARATAPTLGLFGLDWDYMKTHRVGFFILQAHVKCQSPLAAHERVRVYTRLIGRTEKRFHFMHFMSLGDLSVAAATCEMIGAYIDLTQRRMAPLPTPLADHFDQWLAGHNDLDWQPPVCGAMWP